MSIQTVIRRNNKLLMRPEDLTPSDDRFSVTGVFNPGVALFQDKIKLLVRVTERPKNRPNQGEFLSPRITRPATKDSCRPQYAWDIYPITSGATTIDPNLVFLETGAVRLAHISHLRLVTLSRDGRVVENIEFFPELFAAEAYEEYGIEDPRITQIGDSYFITYVAISRWQGVVSCLMKTRDFKKFSRLGIIFPCENKDVIIHPERINGRFLCYHRPVPFMAFSPPAMAIAWSDDLVHWGGHRAFFPCFDHHFWDGLRNGGGTTPIKTSGGWLQLYHGVGISDGRRLYQIGALLADIEDPTRVIARSKSPILSPELEFEISGYYPYVVFATGWIVDPVDSGEMIVFYGCADQNIAVVNFKIKEILATMETIDVAKIVSRTTK